MPLIDVGGDLHLLVKIGVFLVKIQFFQSVRGLFFLKKTIDISVMSSSSRSGSAIWHSVICHITCSITRWVLNPDLLEASHVHHIGLQMS